ncbi:methionine sulfoxide reductase (plasmid) [Fulvitalea axinellae]|uniref:Methionine sulfoxide reductase n=1 Tax=Fulvitalea axinellae TaxID=1182444 RepID=A0AAU9DF13_9BACT|nr:methionine sulfoxide reductase [Fulvitalea axinellae]
MKKFPKTIKLFLIDGEADGRMTGELSNWTGKALRIPRILVKESYDRPELQNPGVYFLFGKDEDQRDLVYIGEAETIIQRLRQHLDKKEFWTEALIFISKDENLNKAHVKYLEHRLHQTARKAGRHRLENATVPAKTSISEAEQAEMEEFIENLKLLTAAIGHRVFEPLSPKTTAKQKKSELFRVKNSRGADATGTPTPKGFAVHKDSLMATDPVPSMSAGFRATRQKLLDDNTVILDQDGNLRFRKDHEFTSPSTAAAVLLGRNANGLIEWKRPDGTTLKQFESGPTEMPEPVIV